MSTIVTSQVVLVIKNPSASAGDIRDTGSTPVLGRSPGEGNATHSSLLGWKILWTDRQPGGLQSMGLQRVGQTESDLACLPSF